ncbi:GntR family transcriptional regulator [Actinomadura chokoriensis]|uniref:GntR family transcriptional regulator n=1 Tax=Actinomadura chokoriensis TaxID=454156 RepID=A0ABV4QNA9_9ACTN
MVRAVDRVYARLRADILDGVHPPGGRLGEAELAGQTGSSRTPVREALRRLEVEGLVEVLPHRGARVPDLTPEDLEEIYDLRMLLEGAAARRAATRITPKDVDRMDELCGLMERSAAPGDGQDLDRIAELNAEFHGIVRAAAASVRLVSMLNAVVQLPLVTRTFHRYSPDDLARSAAHHRELAAALRAADGTWAESVMRAHVLAAKAVLLRAVDRPGNDDTETRTS